MDSCGSSVQQAADLLTLNARRDGEDAVVAVGGELDLDTAPLVERTLSELIDDQSCRSILIDLRDLTFVGSTGLCLLLNAQAHVQSRGGEMVLAHPSSAVMRILEIAGLVSTFTIRREVAPSGRASAP
jgi:anti-sigma B factor antagonist